MHFISIITSIPPKIIRHKIMEVDLMGNPDLDDSKIGNWNSSGAGGRLSPLSVPGHHGQVFSAGCLSSAGYKTLHSFHILCSFLYIDLRVSCIYSTLLTSSLKIFIWAFSKASALAKKKKILFVWGSLISPSLLKDNFSRHIFSYWIQILFHSLSSNKKHTY